MSKNTVIKVENLGKMYRIGINPEKNKKKNIIVRTILSPVSYLIDTLKKPSEEEIFWALKNINFEVQQGEVLGIIGRNGAGKSTLLKILSRITEPTMGSAKINGRIGSLLEVGTGFHPDLTGRENVYLNGSLLGMKKQEIKKNFDEIVNFAGVEKFIDTPVKKYSSGMHVRLGFAVAAHLQPEILIIDEVLAVGDVEFQKKCLGKMQNISDQGRTVLFVSHNMAAVSNLCKRVLVIKDGGINFSGDTKEGIEHYLMEHIGTKAIKADLINTDRRLKNMECIATEVCFVENNNMRSNNKYYIGDDIEIDIKYNCKNYKIDLINIGIINSLGDQVATVGNHISDSLYDGVTGEGILRCIITDNKLIEGDYYITLMLGTRIPWRNVDFIENALTFTILNNNYYNLQNGDKPAPAVGYYAQKSKWINL